jgi:hypothetical protein
MNPFKKQFFDILSQSEGNLLGKTIVSIFSGICISSWYFHEFVSPLNYCFARKA